MVKYYFPENVHEEALSLCFGVTIEDEYNPRRTRVYRAKDESIQGFPEYTIKFEHIKRNFDRQASFPDSNLIKFNH
ncbi:hypothetical protein PRIPAC_87473, partial [Pristionchus pacificus]|uniref:Uncharacterized protein n=1 Tax=Pristionchus pacificus TaxID=54126 RepID=A0A2A6B6U9_PRIPA